MPLPTEPEPSDSSPSPHAGGGRVGVDRRRGDVRAAASSSSTRARSALNIQAIPHPAPYPTAPAGQVIASGAAVKRRPQRSDPPAPMISRSHPISIRRRGRSAGAAQPIPRRPRRPPRPARPADPIPTGPAPRSRRPASRRSPPARRAIVPRAPRRRDPACRRSRRRDRQPGGDQGRGARRGHDSPSARQAARGRDQPEPTARTARAGCGRVDLVEAADFPRDLPVPAKGPAASARQTPDHREDDATRLPRTHPSPTTRRSIRPCRVGRATRRPDPTEDRVSPATAALPERHARPGLQARPRPANRPATPSPHSGRPAPRPRPDHRRGRGPQPRDHRHHERGQPRRPEDRDPCEAAAHSAHGDRRRLPEPR